MAIKVNFNGATIQKPGFYGDPLEKTRPWYKRAQLIEFLAKLNIKSAKAALRPRHPYENVDRDEEER